MKTGITLCTRRQQMPNECVAWWNLKIIHWHLQTNVNEQYQHRIHHHHRTITAHAVQPHLNYNLGVSLCKDVYSIAAALFS